MFSRTSLQWLPMKAATLLITAKQLGHIEFGVKQLGQVHLAVGARTTSGGPLRAQTTRDERLAIAGATTPGATSKGTHFLCAIP